MPKVPDGPFKLVAFEAENVKRVRAVALKPDGSVLQVTGQNGQGKSSLLDSLRWGLASKKAAEQPVPIREGAEEARIMLDLGEVIVTRTMTKRDDGTVGQTLVLTSAQGARFNSPQAILDSWLGDLSLDPLDFMRLAKKEQYDVLKQLVPGFDFDAVAGTRQSVFDMRTETGRDLKREQGAAASIEVPLDTPDNPVDIDALLHEHAEAVAYNAALDEAYSMQERAETMRAEAAQLEQEAERKLVALGGENAERKDVDSIRARGAAARQQNVAIEAKRRKKAHEQEAARLKGLIDTMTDEINSLDKQKRLALEAADLPVKGLSLGEEEVIFEGLPFEQASDAAQLRISTAIAMALNPKLRLIRIRDGSLLDAKSMALLAEMAEEKDFQVIIERVIPSEGVGMVVEIVDGSVASVTPSPKKEPSLFPEGGGSNKKTSVAKGRR